MIAPWRAPGWSLTDHCHRIPEPERGVEQMLRLGSVEFGQPDWALTQLRLHRPDLDTARILEAVHELVSLAGECCDAETHAERYEAAVDDYSDALARLAYPADDLMALAGSLHRVDELAARRGERRG